jgi:micrococcal nuclease
MSRLTPFARRRTYGPSPAFTAGQIRLTVLSGVMLGLIAFESGRFPPGPMAGTDAPLVAPGHVRVIDGDTFVYAGARIRIADIDTPEVHGRCPEESALAARATRRLGVLLAQGDFELHRLPGGRDHDRYGRELRIVTRGGRSVGDILVSEGLARTWTGRREPWCE